MPGSFASSWTSSTCALPSTIATVMIPIARSSNRSRIRELPHGSANRPEERVISDGIDYLLSGDTRGLHLPPSLGGFRPIHADCPRTLRRRVRWFEKEWIRHGGARQNSPIPTWGKTLFSAETKVKVHDSAPILGILHGRTPGLAIYLSFLSTSAPAPSFRADPSVARRGTCDRRICTKPLARRTRGSYGILRARFAICGSQGWVGRTGKGCWQECWKIRAGDPVRVI